MKLGKVGNDFHYRLSPRPLKEEEINSAVRLHVKKKKSVLIFI